jgi:hypothetical protein
MKLKLHKFKEEKDESGYFEFKKHYDKIKIAVRVALRKGDLDNLT